jgi:pimeloyl-[acyl-carrier protein] methyl ester esterase
MAFIETSAGVNIYYEEKGEGRPLVMLHGWSGSGRLWHFQRELADSFRLVIPDLRGHGRSGAPASGYLLEDLAGDIVALFERLDLKDSLLLGWSLGSQVALAAFPQLRERISGLVLVGATPRFTATDGYPHGLTSNELRGMWLRLRRDFNGTMGAFFRGMFAAGELTIEQEEHINREIVMGGHLPAPAVASASLEILSTVDLREMLPAIDRPVLLIHGSLDAICPPGAARYMAKRLPDARLIIIDGAGHAPCLSRPDEFNAILRDYLQEEVYDRD